MFVAVVMCNEIPYVYGYPCALAQLNASFANEAVLLDRVRAARRGSGCGWRRRLRLGSHRLIHLLGVVVLGVLRFEAKR